MSDTKIFGVNFRAIKPSPEIYLKTSTFIKDSNGRYHDDYDCYECPNYIETCLIRIYTKKTVPSRLRSLWLCNGNLFKVLPGTIEELQFLSFEIGLNLSDKNIVYYAALLSKSLTELDDFYLSEPYLNGNSVSEICENPVLDIQSKNPNYWEITSHHVSNDDRKIARVTYKLLKSGVVDKDIRLTLLDIKAPVGIDRL